LLSVILLTGCCKEIVEPPVPQLFGVVPGNRSLTLYWAPAFYEKRERECGTHPPDPDFEGYNVYCYQESTLYDSSRAFQETFRVNPEYVRTGEFKVDGLTNGTTYFVHVTAWWNTGSSWMSNPGSGIPKADSLRS
ncbi:MAG: fibronectin type III domain-containing protein, partial [bacterium]